MRIAKFNSASCKKYAQILGFDSILRTKSVGKINSKGLRYVPQKQECGASLDVRKKLSLENRRKFDRLFEMLCGGKSVEPSKTTFKGLKQARQYAKERCMPHAFETENPQEYLVVIDKKTNKVAGEFEGDRHSVTLPLSFKTPKRASYVHPHPINTTDGSNASTPVSWHDFVQLNKTEAEDIIAFNEKGEFSLLMKKPNFKKLSDEQIEELEISHRKYIMPEKEFISAIIPKLPKEFHGITTYKQLKAKVQELKNLGLYSDEFRQKCREVEASFRKIGMDEIRAVHQFWLDFGNKLGVIYRTNYSYL